MDEQPRKTKRIGDILLERNYITTAQLEAALAQQRATGQFLGAILLKAGAVTDAQLLEVFSEQFGIPCEPLSADTVDWSVVKQFQPAQLVDGNCFPVRGDQWSVTVAIINPLDAWGLSAFERVAGQRRVKPVLVLERELRAVIQDYKRQLLQAVEARLRHGNV
jgi:hypothetical protein